MPTKGRRTNKYGAKRTTVDGIKFHSKLEAERYLELKARQDQGIIRDLQLQIPFPIHWPGLPKTRENLLFTYVADFAYKNEASQYIVEDVKGRVLNEFRIKKKAVRFDRGIEVAIVTKKNRNWYFNGKVEEDKYFRI